MLSEYNAGYVLAQRRTADLTRELELRRSIAERAAADESEAPVAPARRARLRVRLHNPFGASHGHRLLTLH